MTVRELIEKLKQENQDAVVCLDDWDEFAEVTSVDTHVLNGKEMVIIE
jgi:hypothetical protein